MELSLARGCPFLRASLLLALHALVSKPSYGRRYRKPRGNDHAAVDSGGVGFKSMSRSPQRWKMSMQLAALHEGAPDSRCAGRDGHALRPQRATSASGQ